MLKFVRVCGNNKNHPRDTLLSRIMQLHDQHAIQCKFNGCDGEHACHVNVYNKFNNLKYL